MSEPVRVIHILVGGPDRYMTVGGSTIKFEDHPIFGPVVLGKRGEMAKTQPGERDLFWTHYYAWVAQGKKIKPVDGKDWCLYETPMQSIRKERK